MTHHSTRLHHRPSADRAPLVARSVAVLAVTLVAALALAPAASAESGPIGRFDLPNPFLPADSTSTSGVGGTFVDPAGGRPDAGDVYVSRSRIRGPGSDSRQGGFVQQLSPTGQTRRIWGADIVASGPGDSDETQAVRVSATAGSFTLTANRWAAIGEVGGQGEVLAGSTTIENVIVSEGSFAAGQRIVAQNGAIPAGTTIVAVAGDTLTISKPVSASIFNTHLFAADPAQAATTPPLAFGATAQQVQDALNALPPIAQGGGSVTVSGGNLYLVAFDGGPLHGVDQPLLAVDASGLTGTAEAYTINPGDSGLEVCETGRGDVCQDPVDRGTGAHELPFPVGAERPGGANDTITVDQAGDGIYLTTSNRRVDVFAPDGEFLRSFGYDVVRAGPGDSDNQTVQRLTLSPSAAGSYTLTLTPFFQPAQTTALIGVGAPAAALEAAIEDLPELTHLIEDKGGSLRITRSGAGIAGDPYVYEIAFEGALEGDNWNELRTNPQAAGSVTTLQDGGGLETCTAGEDACKLGQQSGGKFFGVPGALSNDGDLAVAPPAAPNAGNLLIGGANRVDEFTPEGEFVRAFGWDVVASGPSQVAAPDETQQVTVKATGGTFTLQFVSSGGNNTTAPIPYNATPAQVESALEALDLIGGAGGTVTVTGGPGDLDGTRPYEITFGGSFAGDGVRQLFSNAGGLTISSGTKAAVVTTLVEGGAFEVCKGGTADVCKGGSQSPGLGQFGGDPTSIAEGNDGAIYVVDNGSSGFGLLPPNRRVQKFVPAGGLDLTPSLVGVNETQRLTVNASADQFRLTAISLGGATFSSPDLPYNAPAADPATPGTIDSIEEAVDDLLSQVGDGGASVSVSGGPGDAGGNTPYEIVYDGGTAPRTDFQALGTAQGTPPLSGGSGPGANQATVETLGDGGPSGRSNSDAPSRVSLLPSGNVRIFKQFPANTTTCPADWPLELAPLEVSRQSSRAMEFSPDGLTLLDTSPACIANPDHFFDGRVSFGNPPSFTFIGEAGEEPQLSLDPVSGVGSESVTIRGEIDPNGPGPVIDYPPNLLPTRYAVDFREVGDSEWTRFVTRVPIGSGDDPVPFSVGVGGLTPKTDYEARVVVLKEGPFTPLAQVTSQFTTLAGRPRIASPFFDNLSANSVDLHAKVNPSGAETTYRFEYGPTISYGQSTAPVSVGDGSVPIDVQATITGLEAVVQHFRVVATNSEGTTIGPDQTFNFYPEPCPNSTARQQTASILLPDCRAYELVSPGQTGTISLAARGPTSPLASAPPRFVYGGFGGILPGPWNPPNTGSDDFYVATRTGTGWQSRYVGIDAQQGDAVGNPGDSFSGLSLRGDHGLGRFLQWGPTSRNADVLTSSPHLFDAQGSFLGRLPSNLDQVPGGDLTIAAGGFAGNQLLSGDGEHFFYASVDVAMAPGGLVIGAGSVYRNDIETGQVSVVSKTETGADIPPAPGGANEGRPLGLAGASTDGSRVLIAAPAACGSAARCPLNPAVLYMRVGDSHSFDVSEGRAVSFEGMSRDGSRVFFAGDEQLTGDDTDASTDLYMWSEATDSLTRVSTGDDPIGDTDACNASWIAGCGAAVVPHDNSAPGKQATDNAVAAANDAVYFYSPEQLVGAEGFPGRRNLYAYRDGQVSFVAGLDADKPATRIQVSADGRFAAFITRSRLTGYDNAGHAEMYRFDEATGELVCVSCIPDGTPASHDAQGSQNGIFMSDDGRAFFATRDPLVPLDADGLVDVYEYVQGRAQLITTGVAASSHPAVGLVGVSADGVDAYFSTLETLVAQDQNGPFLKFYDARTNGGFAVPAQILPCAAAAECHGPGNASPATPSIGSGGALGAAGSVRTPPKPRCRRGKVRRGGKCVPRRCGKGKVRRGGKCVPRKKKKKQQRRHQRSARHANPAHGGGK